MKAVIPAAGLGTRMLPATKSMPKEMLPVVDKPVIQYVVEEAVDAGCDEILIVTGRGKRAIEDHFDRSFELEHHLREKGKLDVLKQMEDISELADIHYVRQKEPLGLGHAVLCAKTFVGDDPFAVLLGDDIFVGNPSPTKQLVAAFQSKGMSCFSVMAVPQNEIRRYGCVAANPLGQGMYEVTGLVEKPEPHLAPSSLAVMGRYVFGPEILSYLADTRAGLGGEIQLTDAMDSLASKKGARAVETRAHRVDVGTVAGFIEANIFMARQAGFQFGSYAADQETVT